VYLVITVRTSKKWCCLPIIVQASRSKGVCLLAHLCFFWFNVWTFMRKMLNSLFDVLFLMHNALLKMLFYEHLNMFGHSNLKMTETWCWTLCSKVWYWYHVFLAEQSYVECFPSWLSLIFSFLCNFLMNFSYLSQPQELKYK